MGCCVGFCCVIDCGFCCVVDCCVFDTSSGCGYHPSENKTEAHATKIANELAAMKEKISASTGAEEEEILNSININLIVWKRSIREIMAESSLILTSRKLFVKRIS